MKSRVRYRLSRVNRLPIVPHLLTGPGTLMRHGQGDAAPAARANAGSSRWPKALPPARRFTPTH